MLKYYVQQISKGDTIVRNQVPVLDVLIDITTMDKALKKIKGFIATKSQPRLIATANAEMVMLAQQDIILCNILNTADLIVPDGAGVVWAIRRQGIPLLERVAGFDLVQQLLQNSAANNYRFYFLGGSPGIAQQAKANAEKAYPGVQIVGVHDGFFSVAEEKSLIEDIKSCNPDILLVALGVPKQEKWLSSKLQELNIPVSIGVGGTFDVMAGIVTRAPLWMQKASLEWLYRLLRQPTRLLRMLALPQFVFRVITAKKIRQK